MLRLHLLIVLVFVVAIASNCLLVSQLSLDSLQSSDTAIGASNSSNDTADSGFLIADDDHPDDVLYGPPTSSAPPARNTNSAHFDFRQSNLTAFSFSQYTILRI
jgi:hypothetical protein